MSELFFVKYFSINIRSVNFFEYICISLKRNTRMILKQLTPQILSEVGFPNCKSVNFATLAESVKMTEVFTTGKIGRNGIKVHAFNTSYFEHKGEKYLSYYYAGCGAETYKSGTAATYDTDISKVTCQKCLDRIAKGL